MLPRLVPPYPSSSIAYDLWEKPHNADANSKVKPGNIAIMNRDTRSLAKLLTDAYVEVLVGLFSLRIPAVQNAVRSFEAEMTVLSSYDGEHIILQSRRVVDEARASGAEVVATMNQATAAFVTLMWDLLKNHAHYERISTEPEIQFFRHLRNACGHNGLWNFAELKHPARWRDKELTMHHRNLPVFEGLLKHGDVVLLFIDIDLKYFTQ